MIPRRRRGRPGEVAPKCRSPAAVYDLSRDRDSTTRVRVRDAVLTVGRLRDRYGKRRIAKKDLRPGL
jgi:hypothetical protein